MGESRPGIDGVDVFMRPYDWPPPREAGGQCMDCGLLARRSIDPSRPGIDEVTVEDRKLGRLFTMRDGRPSIPWCSVLPSSIVDLQREVEAIAAKERAESSLPAFVQVSTPESDVMGVLTLDRKCPEWWWYTSFLSPSEHRQERNMMRLEQDRRAHDLRLAAIEERARHSQRVWTVMFALFAIAAIFVQLIYPNGIDWNATAEWLRAFGQ